MLLFKSNFHEVENKIKVRLNLGYMCLCVNMVPCVTHTVIRLHLVNSTALLAILEPLH